MWCSDCHQDVPGVASVENSAQICCTRCGSVLSSSESAPSPAVEGWDEVNVELEQELQAANRLVHSLRTTLGSPQPEPGDGFSCLDLPHASQPLHLEPMSAARQDPTQPTVAKRKPSWLVWTAISVGMMVFFFGAVLLIWGYAAGRSELWNLGMPFALGGQAVLLIGLLLNVESIWKSSQQASETLGELDGQLAELRRATAMLNTTHSQPSQSFYAHLAEGAHPHMLLADIKSQLDVIERKYS